MTPERISENFVPALYASRALDRCSALDLGKCWRVRDDRHGAGRLWHDYLAHRATGETDPRAGRFVEVRQAAAALRVRTSSGVVDGLCWPALENGTKSPGRRQQWVRQRPGPRLETDAAAHLLCAAAYFDELSVAAALLETGDATPVQEMDLFPQALDIAAFRGHAEMLDLFQNHLWAVAEATGDESGMPHDLDEDWIRWSADKWPRAIRGALLADDLPMLQRAIFPPTLSDYPPPVLSKRFVFAGTGDASLVSNLTGLQW